MSTRRCGRKRPRAEAPGEAAATYPQGWNGLVECSGEKLGRHGSGLGSNCRGLFALLELGPDPAPVVGTEIAPRYRATGGQFNRRAASYRNRARAAAPLPNQLRIAAQ